MDAEGKTGIRANRAMRAGVEGVQGYLREGRGGASSAAWAVLQKILNTSPGDGTSAEF